MPMVIIRVELLEDDIVVQTFSRRVNPNRGKAQAVIDAANQAQGWLQAYSGAVNDRQWENDVALARRSDGQAGLSPAAR